MRKILIDSLPEMMPESEDETKALEVVNEIFTNYMANLYRLEKLREQNKELKNKQDEERIVEDIQDKVYFSIKSIRNLLFSKICITWKFNFFISLTAFIMQFN